MVCKALEFGINHSNPNLDCGEPIEHLPTYPSDGCNLYMTVAVVVWRITYSPPWSCGREFRISILKRGARRYSSMSENEAVIAILMHEWDTSLGVTSAVPGSKQSIRGQKCIGLDKQGVSLRAKTSLQWTPSVKVRDRGYSECICRKSVVKNHDQIRV
jgi:hypothetical protein